jgi:heat shock protein HtpX
MNRATLLQARVRSVAVTAAYLGVLSGLLMLSGYLFLGSLGVLMMLALTFATLLASGRLSLNVVMRMRGARPLHAGEADSLPAVVARLARAAGLQNPPQLYLVPARELQAFAVMSGGQTAIGISPSLLRELSPDELEGVLAHELSHLANGDTRVMAVAAAMRGLTRSLASLAWLLLLVSVLVPSALSVSLGAMVLFLAAPMLSYLAELGLSRTREFNADLAAAQLTGRPESLARALLKLEQHQRGLLRLLVGRAVVLRIPEALRTHPSTAERIRRLLELRERPPSVGSGPPRAPLPQPSARSVRWSVTMI